MSIRSGLGFFYKLMTAFGAGDLNFSLAARNTDFLFDTILRLKTREECRKFFADLCTYKEIDAMAQRLCAAQMLLSGETYEEIIEKIRSIMLE